MELNRTWCVLVTDWWTREEPRVSPGHAIGRMFDRWTELASVGCKGPNTTSPQLEAVMTADPER